MTIDFTTKLKDFKGNDIMGIAVKDGVPVVVPATLGSVAADALANTSMVLTMEEKIRAFKLAQSVLFASQATLSSESISLIKKCIAAAQSPVVVGRCFEILDPSSLAERDE